MLVGCGGVLVRRGPCAGAQGTVARGHLTSAAATPRSSAGVSRGPRSSAGVSRGVGQGSKERPPSLGKSEPRAGWGWGREGGGVGGCAGAGVWGREWLEPTVFVRTRKTWGRLPELFCQWRHRPCQVCFVGDACPPYLASHTPERRDVSQRHDSCACTSPTAPARADPEGAADPGVSYGALACVVLLVITVFTCGPCGKSFKYRSKHERHLESDTHKIHTG